ncbi:hypothetical protein ARMSODRAFT_899043, partial [Armillaria solidipes]
SLVTWIAIHEEGIKDLFTYSDDDFLWEFATVKSFYKLYKELFPAKQAKLLCLWNHLEIPHTWPKQVSDRVLVIIGYNVNINEITATLSSKVKSDLISNL